MGKHIILVHGFLLSGTGSNIYCFNLAQQWKKQGHAVTIFCQDPDAGSYHWVDEFYGAEDELPTAAPKPGVVRVWTPDIAGLLPVYQYDEYKGYTVKTIPNCTDEEIERHIDLMAKAIRKGVDLWGCDKVLSNHALLQPINVKRGLEGTGVPFDIKIHGSAITFILEKFPKYKKYAVEAINACNKVIAGTQHIRKQILKTFPELDLTEKLEIVPPGMDADVFGLCTSIEANTAEFLKKCDEHIAAEKHSSRVVGNVKLPKTGEPTKAFHSELVELSKTYNQRVVDCDIRQRFPKIQTDEPVIIFFGKFLYTKGIGEILLAFPEIVSKYPKVRLILVGFGIYREHIELMMQSMVNGDKQMFKAAAHCSDAEGYSFLESSVDIDECFKTITAEQASRILVTGCLNHAQLGSLLPMASVSLMVSKANEAFGMVSVEAMSAGVLPLCVYHSGITDVLDKLKETEVELENLMHIPADAGGDLEASNGATLIKVLPGKVFKAFDYLYPAGKSAEEQFQHRQEVGRTLRAIAVATWSWDGICKKLADF